MKKFSTLILVSFLLSFTAKTFAQIPNGDFENWSLNTSGILDPDGWSTYNLGVETCSQYQPAQNGNLAVKLTANDSLGFFLPGSIECYFHSTQKPLSIDGYYQAQFAANDILIITLELYDIADNIIASGTLDITANANAFTAFSIPLTYSSSAQPDSAVILIYLDNSNQNNLSSYAIIDNLRFVGTSGVEEISTINPVKLWPNPSAEYLNVFVPGFDMEKAEVRILDISGRIINTEISKNNFSSPENMITLTTSNLEAGMYVVSVMDKNKIASKTFLVNR
jgi:hypothetical protein